MAEFRTTIKPDEKDEVISVMTTALYQVMRTADIRIEEHARIVLVKIHFDSAAEAEKFVDLLHEQRLPLKRWVVYDGHELHTSNLSC